jgi:hypothetical protein
MITFDINSHISGNTWDGIPSISFLRNSIPLSLSGAYIHMQVRQSIDSPVVLDLDNINGGIMINTPALSGIVTIPPQIVDIPVGNYIYDLKLILSSGETKTYMGGKWTILPKVTR